jgi:hypothetical protein
VNCTICKLPLNIQTARRQLPECYICRRNRTHRERVRDGKQPFSQWMTGRIVGRAMAKLLTIGEHA